MPEESPSATSSTLVRASGGIVVLATIAMVVLIALLVSKPWMFTARHTGDLLGRGLIGSMIVSGVGGFWMLAVTKRTWWILMPLVVSASIVLPLIFARAMGVAGMH